MTVIRYSFVISIQFSRGNSSLRFGILSFVQMVNLIVVLLWCNQGQILVSSDQGKYILTEAR